MFILKFLFSSVDSFDCKANNNEYGSLGYWNVFLFSETLWFRQTATITRRKFLTKNSWLLQNKNLLKRDELRVQVAKSLPNEK